MRIINVVKFLESPHLLAPEKGEILCKEIKKFVGGPEKVQLDFTGYEFISSAFLNRAFGQLCIDMDWDKKVFFETISFIGLDDDDKEDLELSIDNAQTRRTLIRKNIDTDTYFTSRLPA